jgi:hypothetical protein
MEHYKPSPIDRFNPERGALIAREDIEEHLALLSVLDRSALLNTLIPHRTLPEHDPARHIIDHHAAELQGDKPMLRSSYDLGVVFGRSLLMRRTVRDQTFLPPVITDFDEEKKQLINRYLQASSHKDVYELVNFDADFNGYLERAVDLFCHKCELVVPDLMLDGEGEVLRGVHDYFSVVSLLESQREAQRSLLHRRLGARRGVGVILLDAMHLRFRSRRSA